MSMMLLSQLAPGEHRSPRRVSQDLRHDRSPDLRRRRGVVGLALLGAGAMAVVSLYQTGMIRHLPEPRSKYLGADEVDASDEAYARATTPDGLLGLTSYAFTATLAGMGGASRARRRPWISLALAGKVLADTVIAAKLTRDQWTKHRRFCSYCLAASAATFAMIPLIVPEVRHAVRALRDHRH
ncbi:MAG TPA: vitamin K epoxide reductase family protein [Tepidisphaeraceae bacterium]|nr:vitamin K epoxide reductase family protein [Tepidisphaeraceae bacterium]